MFLMLLFSPGALLTQEIIVNIGLTKADDYNKTLCIWFQVHNILM